MVPRSARIWSSQSKLKKPVYEIRSAQNRAYSPTGRLHKPLETEIRDDKINPDPYAKRTAGRVAATPALQSIPVGPAQCTPQARACRFLEYPHLDTARAHGAKPGRRARPTLESSPSQFPCLTKPITIPNSANRFTTTCGSNIPNGSSQMANPPCACWNYSIL
jgi:hypothetical protein